MENWKFDLQLFAADSATQATVNATLLTTATGDNIFLNWNSGASKWEFTSVSANASGSYNSSTKTLTLLDGTNDIATLVTTEEITIVNNVGAAVSVEDNTTKTASFSIATGGSVEIEGYDANSGDGIYTLSGVTGTTGLDVTDGHATVTTSSDVAINAGGNTFGKLKGTATIDDTGTATLAAGAVVTGVNNKAMKIATGDGSTAVAYTVNGTALSIVDDDTAAITLTPASALDNAAITVASCGASDTIEVTSAAGAALTFGAGGTQWTEISKGVKFTGNATPADATAELEAGESAKVATFTVTSVNGTVTVDKTGAVSGLGAGESVTVLNAGTTHTWSASADGIVTHTTSTGLADQYRMKDATGTIGLAAGGATPVAGTTTVSAYAPDDVYGVMSDGSTVKLATLATNQTREYHLTTDTTSAITGDLYYDGTKYRFTFYKTASSFSNGVTIDTSGISAAIDVKSAANSPTGTTYSTGEATFQITDNAFTLTGNALSTLSGPYTVTLSNGTIKLNDITKTATVKTSSNGTFTITQGTAGTTVSSAGVIRNLAAAGNTTTNRVVLAANKDAEDNATTAFSINGTSFSAVSTEGATIGNNNASGTATLQLVAGSLVVAAGTTQAINNGVVSGTAKVTGGDGVVLTAAGLISDLEEGESVTLEVTGGAAPGTYVYSVTGGVLEKSYTTTLGVTTNTYYTLTGNSISTTGDYATVNTSEYDAPTTVAVGFGANAATANAVSDLSTAGTLYLTSDGTTSLSSTKAVASLSQSNDVVSYRATSGAKGQTVNVKATNDNAKLTWDITTTGNGDNVTYASNSDATISTGAGKDQITVNTGTAAEVSVNAGDGNNTVDLTGTGTYTVSVGSGKNTVNATGAGNYNITMGSGGGLVDRTGGTDGNATIVGGSGKDTIIAAGVDDVVTGGSGADTFDVRTTGVKVGDYDYGANDVFEVSAAGTPPTVTVANYKGDGTFTAAGGTVDVSAGTNTGEYYAVALVDGNGKNRKNVAWAKEGGSTIDITTYDQAVTLIGDADGANALYAGTKADTIYSYADSDSVYGGAGKDSISLKANGSGRVVGVATTSSKDTVSGFTASFEEGDSIYMVDGSASDVKVSFANNTVTFKDGEGSLQLNNVATSSTTGAVELNVHGTKMALTGTNGVIATDSTSYADFYVGDNAAVSFATADGAVNVDLRNGLDSGAEGAKFSGITAVTGGAGNNTLIGSTAADSIYAGTGASSLWGGAGKDSLIGSTASDAFFIGAGDGSDVVTNFSAAGNENADTVYALNDITGAKLTNNGVEISVGDTDKLTLKNVTADTAIKFNSNGNAGIAKVGSTTTNNNFSYDSTVTYYGGGNKSDKIAFASGSTENAEIWMDGSHGKSYASIDVVDGANTSGNLLVAGDSSSQSIIGGKGDTSLWGGAGSVSDTLRSSSGSKTMFWWGAGEGNDLVISASADDSVNLYNLKLSDVDSANSSITNSGVVLALNDGSKLTVQSSRDVTFGIDGQSWTAQHNSKEWKQNS